MTHLTYTTRVAHATPTTHVRAHQEERQALTSKVDAADLSRLSQKLEAQLQSSASSLKVLIGDATQNKADKSVVDRLQVRPRAYNRVDNRA